MKIFHADKEDNRGEQEDKESGEKVKFYFRGLTPMFSTGSKHFQCRKIFYFQRTKDHKPFKINEKCFC